MLFNVKLLTLATKEPLEPLENALTSVDTLLYPMPGFVTIASITCPFSMTGLTTAPAPVPVAPAPAPATPAVTNHDKEEAAKEDSSHITIKASMIGTFYRSSSPENPPFVNVGDIIKEGDPICIIEAMKLFNEIESEVTGKIIKVLVDDNTPVEFDQPLFLVDPS